MGLVDELAKLQRLRESGALTEEEFSTAKQKLLAEPDYARDDQAPERNTIDDFMEEKSSLGDAANRYVTYQYTAHIIGAIVAIIVIIIFAIMFMNMNSDFRSVFP